MRKVLSQSLRDEMQLLEVERAARDLGVPKTGLLQRLLDQYQEGFQAPAVRAVKLDADQIEALHQALSHRFALLQSRVEAAAEIGAARGAAKEHQRLLINLVKAEEL